MPFQANRVQTKAERGFSIAEIYDCVAFADDRMRPMRRLRTDTLQEYGGRFWYLDDRKKRPMNLLRRGIKVIVAHLAGRNPSFEVTTERMALRGLARKMSKQLKIRAEKTGRVQQARLWLLDACIGGKTVVRIGEKAGAQCVMDGDRSVQRGETSIRQVSIDDWIYDPSARKDGEEFFEGERIRMPRSRALNACAQGIFGLDPAMADPADEALAEQLAVLGQYGLLDDLATPEEAEDLIRRAQPLTDGRTHRREDRSEDLTVGALTAEQRYGLVDTIELIELAIYLDADTCILLTMLSEKHAANKYLRAELWQGPVRGPFEHMEFDPVPDNPHGPSVASEIREQSEVANTVIGKMVNQIERTRRVLVYQKNRAADALKITKASDAQSIGIDGDPKDIADVNLGGLSPELAPFAQLMIGYWNMTGNFDQLGGLGSDQKRTAQEVSQLGVAASVLVEAMGMMFDDFQNRVCQHEAWYFWEDPFIQAPMTMRMEGSEMVEVMYDAQARQGQFTDFNFSIKPRSMQRLDPNVRSQRIMELMQAVVQSAQVEMATQGRVDSAAIARILGREFEIDELDEILRDPQVQMDLMQVYAGAPGPSQGQPVPNGRMQMGQQLSPNGLPGANQRASAFGQANATNRKVFR